MSSESLCWLTRALVSPRTMIAQSLHDNYAWHQMVWKAFPGRDGQQRDFLTRLDDKQDGAQLLIVSAVEPTRPNWMEADNLWETKPIPAAYFQKRQYRFQLRANPTFKAVNDEAGQRIQDSKKRKRRAVTGHAALASWLERKGEAGGFRVIDPSFLEVTETVARFEKRRNVENTHKGIHHSVDFSGKLEITDAEHFHRFTFAKGIGSAKAFGFGLLVLAPC